MSAATINDKVSDFILAELADITERDRSEFSVESRLIGSSAVIRSIELVQLLAALEDYLDDEFGAEFKWADDAAMSEARSIYRSVESLAAHIQQQIGSDSINLDG